MRKQKDISLKHFLEKEDIFCELFNQTVFRDGALHLLAEKLVPVDTRASIRILDADSNVEFFERYRDVVKCGKICLEEGTAAGGKSPEGELHPNANIVRNYGRIEIGNVICGIENQTTIDKLMPSRTLIYDCLSYEHEFRNKMELLPCITITFYTGDKEWKAPYSLYDMLNLRQEIQSTVLEKYIPDYPLYVVDALHLSKDEINKYHTDLRFFFTALQAAGSQDMEIDDTLTAQYVETYDALAMLTGDQRFRVKEGGVSMCALFDMAEERGLKRGIEKGIEAFILDNMEEQIPLDRILEKLQKRFALNEAQAEGYLKMHAS